MKDKLTYRHEMMKERFLLFAFLCLWTTCFFSDASEHDPAAELASFSIAPGFEVSLFASEKHGVVKPIQIRFDPQGRIWVIGSTVYPQLEPGEKPNDKVLVLEDTDRDGKCDKTTTFADGLMIPTGIELGDGGVYLGHGTELLFLKDTDGDLKADERRVVLRGFGTGDNHQNINSFLWGPGGELWFCQGLHTHSNVETPWGIVRMNQAGLWRLRPKLKKLEGFYGSAHEPQNPWGYVFTDWGEPIVIAGNNSSMIYAVPGLTSRHMDLAPSLIWKNGGGRKSSGADIVGTAHFPDEWQGVVITGGYINNAVWALDLKDDGSGFALTDRDPLIKSSSRNFRPVDVKFGPDGSLYICDWYNPIIGHYQASFRHPDRDKTHGRIWRVTAKGRPLTKPPALANASNTELLEQLKSSDRWTRQFAKRTLAERPGAEIAQAVEQWRVLKQPEHALKEALGVLQSQEIVHEKLLGQVAGARDARARAYAAGVVGGWAEDLKDPIALLRPLAADSNARVRLHAIVASSYVPRWEAIEIAAQAAQRSTDRFIDYALRQTVFALKPHWQVAERLGKFVPGADEAYFNLFMKAGETREVVSVARAFLTSSADFTKRAALGKALIANADASDLDWTLSLEDFALRSALLPGVVQAVRQRGLKPSANSEQALRPLVRKGDPDALRLAAAWRMDGFRAEIAKAARTGGSEVQRAAILEALRGWKDGVVESLLVDLRNDPSAALRASALAALATIETAKAAAFASEADLPAELWPEVFISFLQRQDGGAVLAEAFTRRRPSAGVAEVGIRVMNETGRRDEALVKLLTASPAAKLTLADLPALVQEVHRNGNAARGKAIYARAELGCVHCHSVKGQGGTIGPDLGALGTAQPIDFIIGAILEPQREVKEGYIALSISTRDGDEYQGYAVREEAKSIVLRDVLQNAEITIPKEQIQQRKSSGSVMPEGLVDSISRAELADLVKFLSELGE